MISRRFLRFAAVSSRLALLAGLGLVAVGGSLPGFVAPAFAAEEGGESSKGNTIRAELGKPLQAAQELIKQQRYREALAKVAEVGKVSGLTPYETLVVEQLRGIAAQGAGDYPTAAKAFEAAIASGRLSAADQLRYVQTVGTLAYQAKDYGKAITWFSRYLAEGGSDKQTRGLLAQTYFLSNDFANAAKLLDEEIKAAEQSGATVSEVQLQLLANSQLKLDNNDGYTAALEKLAAHYPKPEYWNDVIHRVSGGKGFADRLALDADRLALATGTLTTASQYVDFIELALQAGLPGEAKAVADKGFAAGLLGSGADAERHNRLRALAEKNADDDRKALIGSEQEAAAQKDGTGLVNTGLDYVGHGQPDKGVALIEQGLQKGGLKRPEDAKLHLGEAYLAAGQKAKAVQILKTVEGSDGAASLARLWAIKASQG